MLSLDEQEKLHKFYIGLELDFKLCGLDNIYQYFPEKPSEGLRAIIKIDSLLQINYLSDSFNSQLPTLKQDITIIPYIESRLKQVQNIHLKTKYLHLIYAITKDNRYLDKCITSYKEVLNEYYESYEQRYNIVDFEEVLTTMIELSKKDKEQKRQMVIFVKNYLKSPKTPNRIKTIIIEILQQTNILPTQECTEIPEIAINLASLELDKNFTEKNLLIGLHFANKIQNYKIAKQINEALGDYEYSNIIAFEKGNQNLAIPLMNKEVYKRIVNYYGAAHQTAKMNKALLELKENDQHIIIPKLTVKIPVKNQNEKNRLIKQYLDRLIQENSSQICLRLCMGGNQLLFIPQDKINASVEESEKRFYYTQFMQSVVVDVNGNDRIVDNTEHLNLEYYRTALSITLGFIRQYLTATISSKKLSYSKLSKFLLNKTFFGYPLEIIRNEKIISYSWLQVIDIGVKEFFKQFAKAMRSQDADWRFTIEFLSLKFEGILRDIVSLSGENIVKQNRKGEIESCLLDDLLRTDIIQHTFDEEDIMLFYYTLTHKGLNIRNNVAHCFYKPQDYYADQALLVLLCILRLVKFIPSDALSKK